MPRLMTLRATAEGRPRARRRIKTHVNNRVIPSPIRTSIGREPTGDILSSAKKAALRLTAQVATATSPTLQQRVAIVPPATPLAAATPMPPVDWRSLSPRTAVVIYSLLFLTTRSRILEPHQAQDRGYDNHIGHVSPKRPRREPEQTPAEDAAVLLARKLRPGPARQPPG